MNLLCAAAVVCESFFEEEVDFGIIGVSAIWDNMSIHKNRLWNEKVYQKDETKRCINISNKWFTDCFKEVLNIPNMNRQMAPCCQPCVLSTSNFISHQIFRGAVEKQWYRLLQRLKDFEEEGRINVLSRAPKESLIETKHKSRMEELRNVTNKVYK